MQPGTFQMIQTALSAQMTRLNTVASNLANANSVAGSPDEAFRPLRPVFEAEFAARSGPDAGLAGVRVADVVSLNREPVRLYRPDHPMADPEGFIFQAAVNPEEEMVEMIEASRQYQTTLDAMSTQRTLMMRTAQMGS